MTYDHESGSITFESTGRVVHGVRDAAYFHESIQHEVIFYAEKGIKTVRVSADERREFADAQIEMWTRWRDE